MKLVRNVFVIGLAILVVAIILFYQQYMVETVDQRAEKHPNSLVDKSLNAIVTETSVLSPKGQTLSVNRLNDSLNVIYTDRDTKKTSSFKLNYRDQPDIAIGDTVTKEKGEQMLLIYKKGGIIRSVPVE